MNGKLELHRHHKTFLVAAGLVFAGSCAGSWWTWQRCQEKDEEARTLGEQVTSAKQRIAGIDRLEDEVIVLRENVQGYVRVLPSDTEVNDLYLALDEFRRDAGIQITALDPQQQRGKLASSLAFDKVEYKVSFRATYAQFLQFMARLENHERFVSIAEVQLSAGERDEKSTADPVHDVEMRLVTYVYLGDDVGKGVPIPAYDRKRERLSEQIAEARQELELERVTLLSDAVRRDPLVDPRQRRGKDQPAGGGLEEQRATLASVASNIQVCNALLDHMQEAQNVIRGMELKVQALSLLRELQGQVEQVGARGGFLDPTLRRDWEKRVLPEFTKLKERVGATGTAGDPGERLLVQMQQALAQMEQHWEAGEYPACVRDYELVRDTGAVAGANPEIAQLQDRMDQIYLAAQTAVEFGKKKLEVSGLVVEPGAESVAVINHTVYRVGEAIEDDLVLVEIHEDRLVFEFKGVPLTFDL